MISSEVVLDSESECSRLITLKLVFHRFILPEFNTHRSISKSSSSSRAVPVSKKVESVMRNPAIPVFWGSQKAGMQSGDELSDANKSMAEAKWLTARDRTVDQVMGMLDLGLHKQLTNRLLEPFMWHLVVATGELQDWEHLLALRDHPDAQPEFQHLSKEIRSSIDESEPLFVRAGDWHLPFVDHEELDSEGLVACRKYSAARCARASYERQDEVDHAKELDIYTRLTESDPPHASPFEHVARAERKDTQVKGNFRNWSQMRHRITDSNG